MLFQEDECKNGLWTQPHKGRHKSSVHPEQSFILRSLCYKRDYAHALGRAHDTRLDDINGVGDGSCNEASHDRGREVCCEVILHARILQ